ncbi:ABC transporter ATP-binding protein [Alteromonas aestuariivivens]|uniref:ABC transporter ATP-binding protein n=1 Tax=Alteromonas aestuariivivens TaxID=1938339 RepID=A0A3D8ME74_9ALTE|nr:ABC transporter ATP-binding protein [Alteromonas aestuariivivens]RDV28926.1 ABC transporter ATP-binding protein [Alteromonas aestuariivivens]
MIKLQRVNKYYPSGAGRLHVLKDIDLTIEQGDYLSIMGPSGSGKSTLLNMLGLLDTIDEGEYTLEGHPTRALGEEQRAELRARYIGFIFQSFQLIDRLTAFENVALPLILAEVPTRERRQRVNRLLEQVGLAHRAEHRPPQLSGGQLQRVAIARALVMQPTLILADEPTGNLDQQSGNDIVHLLEALNKEGITLIVVTHDNAVGERAQRRIRMVDGVISQL